MNYINRLFNLFHNSIINLKKNVFLTIIIITINICIFSPLISFFASKYFINKRYNNIANKRNLLEEQNGLKGKISSLKNITYNRYEGFWNFENETNFTRKAFIYISTDKKFYPSKLIITFRLLLDNTINNWFILYSSSDIKNISINNTNSVLLSLKGYFSTEIERGKIFKKINTYNCTIYLNLSFYKNDENEEMLSGNLNIKNNESMFIKKIIKLKVKNQILQEKIYEQKIMNYTICLSIIVILVFIINQITIINIKNSTSYAKSISLLTLFGNIVWSSYGSFIHFYFILTENKCFLYFCFLTGIFIINFILTDLRFISILFRKKNNNASQNEVLYNKKSAIIFTIFYILLFFFISNAVEFLFNSIFILLGLIFTWVPQIIYNYINYNRTSLPYSYIIINSISRIFPLIYFFMNKNNFLLLPTKDFLMLFYIIIFISIICFMQIQIYKGPRFFLKKDINENINNNNCFKTKEELIKENNVDQNECIICLNPLFEQIEMNSVDNFLKIDKKDTSENEIKDVKIEEYRNKKNFDSKEYKSFFNNFVLKISRILLSSFRFFSVSYNKHNKEYILTPCKHVFHAKCLEKWFERKKECPYCRKEIDILM